MIRGLSLILLALLARPGLAQDEDAPERPGPPTRFATPKVAATATAEEARTGRDRALDWLVRTQNPDGSWASGAIEGVVDALGYSVESLYDWQVASCALANLALLEAPRTPERQRCLELGLDWMARNRFPARGSDWDNDAVWSYLYGLVICVRGSQHPRIAGTARAELLAERGRWYLQRLIANQVPTGGWGYYDDPTYTRRPKWATSFSTALVLPALQEALRLGWLEDPAVLQRALRYVRRCRLPNGAYEYDLRPIPRPGVGESINDVKGSLGRIQVCQWALRECGEETIDDARIREGLQEFLRHHRFLDVARMRPIPHEAYYANAGYFYYFGHYYAALAIQTLPAAERESWHARLRPHVLKTLRADGSCCDYVGQRYLVVADTAYAALSLELGLRATEASAESQEDDSDQQTSSAPCALQLLEVRKIWDGAPHNAFTDLVRWRGAFWCAFREGKGHAGDRGGVRVLRSEDGRAWRPVAFLEHPEQDLRDAGLSVTPDDQLHVLGGAQRSVDGVRRTGSFVSRSEDGVHFEAPRLLAEEGRWLWKLTWHEGKAYGVSYRSPEGTPCSSLRVGDGWSFETLVEELCCEGRVNEARLRFDEAGRAWCLHRRDGAAANALIGTAEAPYTRWSWRDTGRRLGGPNLLQLPSGTWLAAGRLYDGGTRTAVLQLDPRSGALTPLLDLPSGGDTSYPGMVWFEDQLWLSYYSSHEARSSIYLARLEVVAP